MHDFDSDLSCPCREAKEDMLVLGYRIPKGTPLMLGPYAMHTSRQNFLQPYNFLPARWVGASEAVTPGISKGALGASAREVPNHRVSAGIVVSGHSWVNACCAHEMLC